MACLHLVFNVIKLLPIPDDLIPRREEHYVVEKILDSRLICNWLHFLIKWDGYSYEENTWVPEHDVLAPNKVHEFY
jgi:hypothetical protein